MSNNPETETAVVLSYVEQRDAALAELAELKEQRKWWRGRIVFLERIARDNQQENAALRRASVASAAHRKALEQLVKDCLKHMDRPADEIVDPDLYEQVILDDWDHERLSLERRFAELTTTQEG